MDDDHASNEDITTDGSAPYFLIAPLFLLCALGYWTGGGGGATVTAAVIGLVGVSAVTALRGWRIRQRFQGEPVGERAVVDLEV